MVEPSHNRVDLDNICHNFYENLYKHREVLVHALKKVFEGFSIAFTDSMNVFLTKVTTKRELASALAAMAKDKVLCHDAILMKFFKQLKATIGGDYHQMIFR